MSRATTIVLGLALAGAVPAAAKEGLPADAEGAVAALESSPRHGECSTRRLRDAADLRRCRERMAGRFLRTCSEIPNTESNSHYLRACTALGRKSHPARFPADLPKFFIKFLTDPGGPVLRFEHDRTRRRGAAQALAEHRAGSRVRGTVGRAVHAGLGRGPDARRGRADDRRAGVAGARRLDQGQQFETEGAAAERKGLYQQQVGFKSGMERQKPVAAAGAPRIVDFSAVRIAQIGEAARAGLQRRQLMQ